jgi:hypothetical protein
MTEVPLALGREERLLPKKYDGMRRVDTNRKYSKSKDISWDLRGMSLTMTRLDAASTSGLDGRSLPRVITHMAPPAYDRAGPVGVTLLRRLAGAGSELGHRCWSFIEGVAHETDCYIDRTGSVAGHSGHPVHRWRLSSRVGRGQDKRHRLVCRLLNELAPGRGDRRSWRSPRPRLSESGDVSSTRGVDGLSLVYDARDACRCLPDE